MYDDQQTETALTKSEAPSWKLATSLESAKLGEVMMLDPEGHVLSPQRIRSTWVRAWMRAGVVSAALGLSSSVLLGSALLGGLAATMYLGAVFWDMHHYMILRRTLALHASGRRDEARAALVRLKANKLPAHYRPIIDMLAGQVAFLHGEFDEALACYQRVIDRCRLAGHRKPSALYWICAFNRVQVMAVSGRVERAKKFCLELDQAPSGEYFAMDRMLTELLIAFHANDHESLEADLYEWAKTALRTNRFGLHLVLLSWAFHCHGDDEMARLLLREAPSRLMGHFLEDSAPQVHAWMQNQRKAWNLDEFVDEDDEKFAALLAAENEA